MNRRYIMLCFLGCTTMVVSAYAITYYDACYQWSCPKGQVLASRPRASGFAGPASAFRWCCLQGKNFSKQSCTEKTMLRHVDVTQCKYAPCNNLLQCKRISGRTKQDASGKDKLSTNKKN